MLACCVGDMLLSCHTLLQFLYNKEHMQAWENYQKYSEFGFFKALILYDITLAYIESCGLSLVSFQ